MAKISSYSLDDNVTFSDKLIGTDVNNNNATKNFSLGQVADLFNNITVLDTFVPYTGALYNVDLGVYNLRASYIEGDEIFSNLLQGNTVDVNEELRIYSGVPISLDGSQGNVGDVMLSQGAGNNPTWEAQSELFFTTPIYEGGNKLTSYAQAFSLVTQLQTSIGAAKTVAFETGSFSNTVTVASNQITFNAIGKYVVEAKVKAEHIGGGGDAQLSFWLIYPASNVANSRQIFTLPNLDIKEFTYSFVLSVTNPSDSVFVQWSTTNLSAKLTASTAVGFYPAAPSAILNVYKIG